MQIWLVRHAAAADRDEFQGPDAQRPLTSKGSKKFETLATSLCAAVASPKVIVTSPLLRAVQTAEILAEAAGLKGRHIDVQPQLAPGATADALCELAARHAADVVALVGHQPDLGHALSLLVGGGNFDVGKGCIAAVEFPAGPRLGSGWLKWFVGPKLLDGRQA